MSDMGHPEWGNAALGYGLQGDKKARCTAQRRRGELDESSQLESQKQNETWSLEIPSGREAEGLFKNRNIQFSI